MSAGRQLLQRLMRSRRAGTGADGRASGVNRELVVEAYRLFLGRDPESEAVIDAHVRGARSVLQFLRGIAESQEFGLRRQQVVIEKSQALLDEAYWAEPAAIEVDVEDALLEALMQRVQRQWHRLGEEEPYWSVLSHDQFRSDRLDDAHKKAFFESGARSAMLVERLDLHAARAVSKGTCFELGCGVGRVTYWLAQRFERVVAADISPGNLALCRDNLERMGVRNVEFLLLDTLDDYRRIEPYDVLYSIIVLQHNSPPIQKLMLGELLQRVRSGGGALFQTPGSIPGYTFRARDYLASPEAVMELHALPMPVVLAQLHAHGLRACAVTPDAWTGLPGSYTYFAIKD